MKKNLLMLIAAIFCSVSAAFAMDTIPVPRYITNFHLDVENGILTFDDMYKPELLKNGQGRDYTIYLINRSCNFKPENRFSTNKNPFGEMVYTYDDVSLGVDARMVGSVKWSNFTYSGEGNTFKIDVSELLRKSYSTMIPRPCITFIVCPQYEAPIGGGMSMLCDYYSDTYEDPQRSYLINYYEYEHNLPYCKIYDYSSEDSVIYGEDIQISASLCTMMGTRAYSALDLSHDGGKTWVPVKQQHIKTSEGKVNIPMYYVAKYDVLGYKNAYYRLSLSLYVDYDCDGTHISCNWSDTSEIKKVDIYFPCVVNGNEAEMHKADETIVLPAAPDCQEYVVESVCPVTLKKSNGQVSFLMPPCPVTISLRHAEYTVKFLNADYTLLSEQKIKCGDDAQAPADPSMAGMTFNGWNKDFTNVHKDMSVMAVYEMGEDYFFLDRLTEHKSEYDYDGFAGSEKRAMMGDSLIFDLELRTPANATVRYQRGLKDSEGNWNWNDPINIGTYNATQADGESRHFPLRVAVAYEYSNKMALRYGEAFRYNVYSAGATILSEPYEFDVYYEMGVKSLIDDPNDPSLAAYLYVSNKQGDQSWGSNFSIPARYNDTVFVELQNGSAGCLNFARTNKPGYALTTGVNEKGKAYFICPGEEESVKVTTGKYVLLFDGAYPIKQFDFTAQGFGKYNAYYAEIVDCGGKIKNMPQDPEMNNSIFLGWKNESFDTYDDDAYLNVPAIGGNVLTFTAQWEDIPVLQYFTVRFLDKDGKVIAGSTQTVAEGYNAVPPVAPEVEGYVFIGWDKPYTSISADTDIQAQYIDKNLIHTVTYQNIDGSILYAEQVYDGQAANGYTVYYAGGVFLGWMNIETLLMEDLQNITSDITVRPVFQLYTFTVNFFDGFMMQIGLPQTVEYGKAAKEPEDIPAIEGYTFVGWDKDFSYVTQDMDIFAQYQENPPQVPTYKVTLEPSDNGEIKITEQNVDLNAVPEDTELHLTAVPNSGYKFTHWSDDSTQNPLTITIHFDIAIAAYYEQIGDALEQIEAATSVPQKIISNGAVLILMPDGKKYSVLGVEIKTDK
ncbi:MAG: InlB B-repeat-containing protein [Paludibacteraceae bacterium]|nr:InlB B-repeat-containing protein [Paludibacteraceae bacterium]